MLKRQFAETRTEENEETLLKLFEENENEEAIAYAAEIAKENTRGVIACIYALADAENNKVATNCCRVYKVWKPKKKDGIDKEPPKKTD